MAISSSLPSHIAVIMDGNGRWAQQHHLPRLAGYKKGLDAVRRTIAASLEMNIAFLTLFAFSTENWRRPAEEVGWLMRLFLESLEEEAAYLKKNDISLRIIGRRDRISPQAATLIQKTEDMTCHNEALRLTIAMDYGGRWDIVQAVNQLLKAGKASIEEDALAAHLSLFGMPEPDLFIRTGGEKRISNFLLWHLAYSELYFTDLLWPDFNKAALQGAIEAYQQRERRFGQTSEQLGVEA